MRLNVCLFVRLRIRYVFRVCTISIGASLLLFGRQRTRAQQQQRVWQALVPTRHALKHGHGLEGAAPQQQRRQGR